PISTILLVVVWMFIMPAYAKYAKSNPNHHNESQFKLPGGIHTARLVHLFFVCVLLILFIVPDTRMGVVLSPIWFILLGLIYFNYTNKERAIQSEVKEKV